MNEQSFEHVLVAAHMRAPEPARLVEMRTRSLQRFAASAEKPLAAVKKLNETRSTPIDGAPRCTIWRCCRFAPISANRIAEFLTKLAKASGIGTPTRADLARIDRKRKKKGSNDDWSHPHDSDAKITKMKDGRTHLAHKAEHAIDLDSRVIVGVTVQGADEGDTTTIQETLPEAAEQLEAVAAVTDDGVAVVVADKECGVAEAAASANRAVFRVVRRRWSSPTPRKSRNANESAARQAIPRSESIPSK